MPQTNDSRDFQTLMAERSDAKAILAEGDSWFAYPRRFFLFGADANIIDHLADYDHLVIYNTSSNGDETLSMLSGEQKFSLIKRLKYNHFDYLLFSGGGNDIVGRYDFDFFIREKGPGDNWQDCILQDRVKLKMQQIEAAYRTLCELVTDYSANPDIRIVTHTYEKLTPRKTGFELFDIIPVGRAWIYPFMKQKKITKAADQKNIIANLLENFKSALARVENDYPFFQVVDTHGTVTRNEWRNEIHPTPKGFGKLAKKIYNAALSA